MFKPLLIEASRFDNRPQAFFFEEEKRNKSLVHRAGEIDIVKIQGVIGWSTTYEDIVQAINEAAGSDSEKIILDINSPGGYTEGVTDITDAIENAKLKKTVIAYTPSDCCSLAYWIAATCHHVVASKTAVLGSIGTLADIGVHDGKYYITMV
jgi:ClpP class serine protease